MEEQQLNPVRSPHVKTRAEAWKAWQAANLVKQLKIKPSAWSKHVQAILRSNEKLLELFVYGVRPNRGEVQVQLRKDQSKVWIKITEGGWCRPRDWLVREDLPFYVHRQEIINDLINSRKYRGGSYEGALLHDEPHSFEENTSKLWVILADAELRAHMDNDPERYIYVREFLKALPEEALPAKPAGYVPFSVTLAEANELNLSPEDVWLYGDLVRQQRAVHEYIHTKDFQDHCDNVLEQLDREEQMEAENIPDNEERVIGRLIEAYETFTGERISRSKARDLIEALELNGLEIRGKED